MLASVLSWLQVLPPGNDLLRIAGLLLVLAIVWIVLQIVLRLAMRIFSMGCMLIVGVGVVLLALRFFR